MSRDNRSFFEKLTGAIKMDSYEDSDTLMEVENKQPQKKLGVSNTRSSLVENSQNWIEEEPEDGELTVDVFQNHSEIIIKTMVAGVRPEDLDITITRDIVTIKGKRETEKSVSDEDYFHQELYWGTFSRTIMLPAEIEVEESEAVEKHGLLIIKLPKIDKNKQARLKVKG